MRTVGEKALSAERRQDGALRVAGLVLAAAGVLAQVAWPGAGEQADAGAPVGVGSQHSSAARPGQAASEGLTHPDR